MKDNCVLFLACFIIFIFKKANFTLKILIIQKNQQGTNYASSYASKTAFWQPKHT